MPRWNGLAKLVWGPRAGATKATCFTPVFTPASTKEYQELAFGQVELPNHVYVL